MILTLIIREIQDKIYSAQFMIIALLCVILIPLGMYVSMKDFEKRQIEYVNNVQEYYQKSQKRVNPDFHAEGYRQPSVLNIFSNGLNDYLPYKITTDRHRGFTIETKMQQSNLISVLFGKIDFTLMVTSFLSILSIIFTFSCISSEKEKGTIALIFSNPVQRWKLVVSKISGNYILFCIPFFLSIIVGLLVLNTSSYISIFDTGFWAPFLFICLATLLLILLLFCLGFLISTITHNSLTSIITLLFIWVFCAFIIPKVSPMIAQIVYPVDSTEVFDMKRKAFINNMEQESNNQLKILYEQKLIANNIDPETLDDLFAVETREARKEYNSEKTSIEEEYNERLQSELSKLDDAYYRQLQRQYSISRNIARISPISSYISLMSEVCHTGFCEIENFRKQAAMLQIQVEENVYVHWTYERIAAGPRAASGYYSKEGVDRTFEQNIPVPEFQYKQLTFSDIIQYIRIDLILIIFFCIVFFVMGFVSFLRYDVR